MVHLKYLSFAVMQTLNLLLSTSQTYVVTMIPLCPWCIVLTHLVPFPTLYKYNEGIQSTSSEGMLELSFLLALLASVVRHIKNSILPLLYNLASKTLPWYLIFSWKIFSQSSASANALIKRSRTCPIWSIALPGAVFSVFSFTERTRPCEVNFVEMTVTIFIWILLSCEWLPQLVKPKFLLGNHL